MPKYPILDRTILVDVRPVDGSFRRLDWNLVNTPQGACMEPAQHIIGWDAGVSVQDLDLDEISYNRELPVDEGRLAQDFGTAGVCVPSNYNTRGT